MAATTICCRLFTNCCTRWRDAKAVADCSQTVADCCTAQNQGDSVSRLGSVIPLLIEGAIQSTVGGCVFSI
jgi:hypothetical protein